MDVTLTYIKITIIENITEYNLCLEKKRERNKEI